MESAAAVQPAARRLAVPQWLPTPPARCTKSTVDPAIRGDASQPIRAAECMPPRWPKLKAELWCAQRHAPREPPMVAFFFQIPNRSCAGRMVDSLASSTKQQGGYLLYFHTGCVGALMQGFTARPGASPFVFPGQGWETSEPGLPSFPRSHSSCGAFALIHLPPTCISIAPVDNLRRPAPVLSHGKDEKKSHAGCRRFCVFPMQVSRCASRRCAMLAATTTLKWPACQANMA